MRATLQDENLKIRLLVAQLAGQGQTGEAAAQDRNIE
jgi:hypothetical protein